MVNLHHRFTWSGPGESSCFLSVRHCDNMVSKMAQETLLARKRGPKPTGKGKLIGVRIQPPELAALDRAIGVENNPPSRPEMIRRLVVEQLNARGFMVPE